MAREVNTINGINRDLARRGGQLSQPVVIGLVLAALAILAIIYFASRESEPEPVPDPGRATESVAPAETAAERGDSAREIIDDLRSAQGGVDYTEAYDRARQFQADGQLADAQLLFFFAARGGHGGAAFDLAAAHDPNHHSTDASLAPEPDPFQAYRWYRTAREAGHESADERLVALKSWAEDAASTGDAEAERLLLQWSN